MSSLYLGHIESEKSVGFAAETTRWEKSREGMKKERLEKKKGKGPEGRGNHFPEEM